jgi:hypothetical protein
VVLVVAVCIFGNIVCPYTMVVVAADDRIRVMSVTIVNRTSSIAMSWYIHNPTLCLLLFSMYIMASMYVVNQKLQE